MDENKLKDMQAVMSVAASVVGVCATRLSQKEERKKRKREHHYLRRRNVPPPTRSAMATMMKGDDETYLFLFRMRKESFKCLLVVFEPIWWTKHLTLLRSVQKQSTRQLTPNLALALVLRYLLTTSEGTTVPETRVGRFVHRGIAQHTNATRPESSRHEDQIGTDRGERRVRHVSPSIHVLLPRTVRPSARSCGASTPALSSSCRMIHTTLLTLYSRSFIALYN